MFNYKSYQEYLRKRQQPSQKLNIKEIWEMSRMIYQPNKENPMSTRLVRVNKEDFKYLQAHFGVYDIIEIAGTKFVVDEGEEKMTRQEAYKKLNNSQVGKAISAFDIPFSKFCDYVEALGLIKFEEEKKSNDITEALYIKNSDGFSSMVSLSEAIKAIQNAGYMVVRMK